MEFNRLVVKLPTNKSGDSVFERDLISIKYKDSFIMIQYSYPILSFIEKQINLINKYLKMTIFN